MSYTVLARRYRSTTFDEVVGQEHVAQTLKKAIESDRVAHAYLFTGTRGVGKTSMARIMAKALNCLSFDAPTATPCGKCDSCIGVARGDDIDVIEIDAASNTGVDNVRDIIENAQYRPARSRFKVYIIDEVHMLSKAAFNALLKTMEEPPGHVKFILATTEVEKVLPTILSRCQRYDFRNIPTREIAGHLRDICKQEKIKADEDALLLVAKAGAGSMRDSLSLLDRLLSIGEKNLTIEMIEQLLGLPKSQLIFDLAEAIGQGDVKAALTQANAMVQGGLSVDGLTAALIDHLRNLLILRTCGTDTDLVEVPGLNPADLAAQSERFDAVALTQDVVILEELRRHVRQSQAGRALLDATIARMAMSDQFASIADLMSRMENGSAGGAAKPRTTATARPASAAGPEKKNASESPAAPVSAVPKPVIATPAVAPSVDASAKRAAQSATNVPVETPAPVIAVATVGQSTPAPMPPPSPSPVLQPVASSVPVPSPMNDLDLDGDDDDSLPGVGKVWEGPAPSLGAILKSHAASTQRPATTSPAGSESNVEPVDTANLAGIWQALLGLLAAKGPGIPALLANGKFIGVRENDAVIRFSDDQMVKMLERNGKKDVLRDALAEVLNQKVGIRFEIVEAPPEAVPTPAAAARGPVPQRKPTNAAPTAPPMPDPTPSIRLTQELVDGMRANNPLVRSIMDRLGGQVVKVEET